MEKRKNLVIGTLLLIIVLLITLLILITTGKSNYSSKKSNNTSKTCDCNSVIEHCNIDELNYEELAKLGKSSYNYVYGDYDSMHSANILADGKVLIDFNNYIANISYAKDLIMFNGPTGNPGFVYILATDGNVYKYDLTNVSKSEFNATKLDDYSNIKNIIRYKTRKANAGGCDYLVIIDSNDKYYVLDSYCV